MLPKTYKMLQEFYQPHNRQLADLLGDESFAWPDPKGVARPYDGTAST